MEPLVAYQFGMAVLRVLGKVGIALLLSLLNGKALKRAIAIVLEKLSKKTKTTTDDRIVKEIENDWGLEPEAPPAQTGDKSNGK